ncbi:MAG: hypothetical protein A2946_03130 [Candidatus Liptonbacteria bacterium RIFCSPLOWO2_01_FULL_53_13]|uniref:Uncharacterized protein n=1 Tax=Candidatus Liptonbacteria bacterium RIFCSPLOWO2_01_FULL_53_13 TaxID=1798651 RepID=A0A1G2CMM2_9BACT|nr:MAG: hypothetical protein A2946_03130 [Candidatus Liptonbacteria bacterium RIFCSPLOWO2_01_FULL_53_13]
MKKFSSPKIKIWSPQRRAGEPITKRILLRLANCKSVYRQCLWKINRPGVNSFSNSRELENGTYFFDWPASAL